MLDVDTRLKPAHGSNDYYEFKIGSSRERMVLKFQDNVDFGHMNAHTSKALEEPFSEPSIQIEVLGSRSAIREAIGKATKATDAIVRVNINVYGPGEATKVRELVAHRLSSRKIYLQRPDNPRPGTVYDNPHVLKFPDMDIPSFVYNTELAAHRSEVSDDPEKLQKILDNVYASLTRGSKLNRIEGDHRVETELLACVLSFSFHISLRMLGHTAFRKFRFGSSSLAILDPVLGLLI
jgi:SWI/SNF-related matrix-associated actin-dependent regulator of chromatin subfamily A3